MIFVIPFENIYVNNIVFCSSSLIHFILLFFNSIVVLLYIVVRFVVFTCNYFGYWLSLIFAPHIKVYWFQFSPNSQHSWWKKHQKGFILGTLQFRRLERLELRLFFPWKIWKWKRPWKPSNILLGGGGFLQGKKGDLIYILNGFQTSSLILIVDWGLFFRGSNILVLFPNCVLNIRCPSLLFLIKFWYSQNLIIIIIIIIPSK